MHVRVSDVGYPIGGLRLKVGFLCFSFVSLLAFPAIAQQETDGEAPDSDIQSLSETQTSYTGAQLLRANTQVSFDRMGPGFYDDERGRDRYAFWEGDSLFVTKELSFGLTKSVSQFIFKFSIL